MKLIIDIPDYDYRHIKEVYEKNDIVESTYSYIYHGTPLDSNDSDYAEAQAYFDGEAYGWEQGRKTLIDDVKAEIHKVYDDVTMYSCDEQVSYFASRVFEILNNIDKESDDKE